MVVHIGINFCVKLIKLITQH